MDSWYRRYSKAFVYEVLEKNGRQKLIWTTEMDEAFNELKKRAANSIALNIPDFCKKFVLVTDASNDIGHDR